MLLVEVPEAEALVASHRQRLDSSAAEGIPAHVTVLSPFVPPRAIDTVVRAELARLFASVPPFRFVLDRTSWFGEEVLWLGPRDPEPFRTLTEHVFGAFPQFPPFGGQHDEVVPHLTVGHSQPVAELRAAEAAVRQGLPVTGRVTAVTLMTGPGVGPGHWAKSGTFTLGNRHSL